MPTTPEMRVRRAEVLLRQVVREVLPHHVPEALRWDIVDFLGDEHEAAHIDGCSTPNEEGGSVGSST